MSGPRDDWWRDWLKEMGVDEKVLDEALDHRKMAHPHD